MNPVTKAPREQPKKEGKPPGTPRPIGIGRCVVIAPKSCDWPRAPAIGGFIPAALVRKSARGFKREPPRARPLAPGRA